MAITYLRSFKAEVKICPHIPQTKLILLVIIYIFLSDGRLAFHQRKPFEETFETHSGIPQMQPVWLCIFWGRQFENAFKKTSRWKVKHMQPELLCILPSNHFDDTCENTKGDEFQTIATNVNLRLLRQAIKESFENSTSPHCGKKPFQRMISDSILGEHSDTFRRPILIVIDVVITWFLTAFWESTKNNTTSHCWKTVVKNPSVLTTIVMIMTMVKNLLKWSDFTSKWSKDENPERKKSLKSCDQKI